MVTALVRDVSATLQVLCTCTPLALAEPKSFSQLKQNMRIKVAQPKICVHCFASAEDSPNATFLYCGGCSLSAYWLQVCSIVAAQTVLDTHWRMLRSQFIAWQRGFEWPREPSIHPITSAWAGLAHFPSALHSALHSAPPKRARCQSSHPLILLSFCSLSPPAGPVKPRRGRSTSSSAAGRQSRECSPRHPG